MKRSIRRLLLVATLLTGLAACQDPSLTSGTVYDKQHTAESTTTILLPIRIGKVTTLYPSTTHNPETWEISIKATIGEKEHRRTIALTREQFDQYQIGDHYPKANDF